MAKKQASGDEPKTPKTAEEFCKQIERIAEQRDKQWLAAMQALQAIGDLNREDMMARMRFHDYISTVELMKLKKETDRLKDQG